MCIDIADSRWRVFELLYQNGVVLRSWENDTSGCNVTHTAECFAQPSEDVIFTISSLQIELKKKTRSIISSFFDFSKFHGPFPLY